MAKRVPRKKVTRRLKRSVRKSLAAVLMITAIVVAAIPVPEMAASNGDDSKTLPARVADYYYDDTDTIIDEKNDIEMDPNGSWSPVGWDKETFKDATVEEDAAHGVFRTLSTMAYSDGSGYQLDWQFKFFQEDTKDGKYGVICDYNSMYFSNEIALSPLATFEYEEVSTDEYDSWISANSAVEYELRMEQATDGDYPDLSDKTKKDAEFWIKYFPDEYEKFMREYDDYVASWLALQNWNGTGKAPDLKPKPNTRLKTVEDLAPDQKLSYYCYINYEKKGTGKDYVLCAVVDRRQKDITNKTVYLPRGGTPFDATKLKNDENGFMINQTTNIIAIGDRAFADTKNVDNLTIPKEIKYIGDEAFYKSFIKSVTLVNVENIGNRAFYGCTELKEASLGDGVVNIGNEAFYGSGITSISFPYSVEIIGGGAFANCVNLESVDATRLAGTAPQCEIGDYAFFNDIALNSVDFGASQSIHKIGKGTFAVDRGVTGNLETFSFPQGISSHAEMGDFSLAGRTNVKYVTMPANFGAAQTDAVVPEYTFYNCNGLEWVKFPDSSNGSCGYAAYDKTLFSEVSNASFFVEGPAYDREHKYAKPRESTWEAQTLVADFVPYVFYENGVKHCEVVKKTEDGDEYLISVDENGTIISISPRPGTGNNLTDIDLVIDAEYGGIPITGLKDGCIEENVLKELKSLTIADNSIQKIDNSVFEGCPKLEKVIIGNAVNSIGARAFADCPKLVDVTFHTPLAGHSGFTIGNEAFPTGSSKLMFHGDIVEGYAPFEWAMDPAVYANEREGIRIAYESLEPYSLFVMLDNNTNVPTLVDYPHYSLIDEDNKEYIDSRIKYYDAISTLSGNEAMADAWDIFKEECRDGYGTNYSIIKKYEDIYLHNQAPYFDFQKLSPFEEALVDGTRNIVVPEAVKSIDIYGFYNAEGTSNMNSIAAYELDKLDTWDSYTNKYSTTAMAYPAAYAASATNGTRVAATLVSKAKAGNSGSVQGNGDIVPGLFSGNYRDYPSGSELAERWETQTKGNDRIETISLLGVTKLPDYAFDDCERLKQVTLGAECTDIGVSPFRGCTQLENVIFNNDAYIYENGIIYKKNDAGMLSIVTCLATRGNGNVNTGDPNINVITDPLLAQVNNIEVSAFDSCESIANVDLTGAEKLSIIPRAAFKNCTSLSFVTLPKNITRIDEEAFYKDNGGSLSATIYGKEVSIRNDAFNHSKQVLLRSYKDSAAEKYADTYGLNFQTIDEGWEVNFMDYDGTFLAETQYVADGNPAVVPQDPTRVDYTFTGWSPTVPDMSTQKITADVTFIAQYKSDSKNDNNNGNEEKPPVEEQKPIPPNENEKNGIYTVTVINGSGSGSYQVGKEVSITANAPSTGRKFDRWESSSLNVAISDVKSQKTTFKMPANNVVVTAVYDGGNGSGSSDSNKDELGNSSGSDGTTTGTGSSGSNGGSTGSGTAGTGGTGGTTTPGTPQNGTVVSIPNGIGISNTGTASATVEGSTDNFVVRITTTPDATAAVERALTNEFGTLDNIRYYPMDISLYDSTGTTPITDTTGLSVNITIPLPDDLLPYAGNNKAGAVVNGDTLEKLGATFKTIDGIPCINFTATHFSPYTIYVDTQNLTAAMDASPKTGDPIHPKWFLALGLACLSVVLFMKKDKRSTRLA